MKKRKQITDRPIARNIIIQASAVIVFVGLFTSTHCGASEKYTIQINDSSYKKLQHFIDSLHEKIVLYDDWIYQKKELQTAIIEYENKASELSDSLAKLNSFNLAEICVGLSDKKNEQPIKEKLRRIFESIQNCEKEKAIVLSDLDKAELSLKEVEIKLNNEVKRYTENKNALNEVASDLEYPGKLQVKGVNYRFFIATVNTDKVYIHNNPNSGKGQSLKDVMNRLSKQNDEALMITNGGMYTPSFKAQGLLIENSKQIKSIDTLKPANNLNFYLQPNGIFFIDSSGYNVSTTDDYKILHSSSQKIPRFATQSGPMLIANGIKNSKFQKGSNNFYIRSGVGLISKQKIVFIISDNPVNFYDFSSVFEQIFGCKNALYLDGAISEMYINPKYSGFEDTKINYRPFGPVISISKIKK